MVILIKDEDKYLLLKEARELMNGAWAPPHGRVDIAFDKNEEDAVIREAKEETGFDVKPMKKVYTIPADTKVKTVSFWVVTYMNG